MDTNTSIILIVLILLGAFSLGLIFGVIFDYLKFKKLVEIWEGKNKSCKTE